MDDQPQFDSLRRTCSARLKQFMTVAHQTEQHVKDISLPVDVEALRQCMSKRQTEYDACHEYLMASQRLADFLQERVQYIQ
jgi:hypothetical protein